MNKKIRLTYNVLDFLKIRTLVQTIVLKYFIAELEDEN